MDYGYIKQNIDDVNNRLEHAAKQSGRELRDITLLAVTKTVEPALIKKALECGVTDLGENRVQELLSKQPNFEGLTASWHLIGHLQTNKVRQVVGKVSMIHSVDSLKLAREIDKRASEAGIIQDILIEVNISGEQSKFGVSDNGAKELIKYLWEMRAIRVKGLMTVAPYVAEGEKNRDLFKKMRHLFIDINDKRGDNEPMLHLSMGMTGDCETAVSEGSSIVRIGTGIFGQRDYN